MKDILNRIIASVRLYNMLAKLDKPKDRISLYRMLYWRTKLCLVIPSEEEEKLAEAGYMERIGRNKNNENLYIWTDKARNIERLFPEIK